MTEEEQKSYRARSMYPREQTITISDADKKHNEKIDKIGQWIMILFGVIIAIVVLKMIFTGQVKLW